MKSVDQGGEITCSVDGRGPVWGEDCLVEQKVSVLFCELWFEAFS
jgi:hypothetical protein